MDGYGDGALEREAEKLLETTTVPDGIGLLLGGSQTILAVDGI